MVTAAATVTRVERASPKATSCRLVKTYVLK